MDFFILLASEDSWWVRWLKEFFAWVWGWFYAGLIKLAVWVVSMFIYAVPENWCPKVGVFLQYAETINCWVALDFGMGLMIAYYMFLLIFIGIKMLLKIIPGVG